MGTLVADTEDRGRSLTFSLSGDFRGRTQLTKLIRQAVSGLLAEAGCERDGQSAGLIVAQELAENLVKYSRTAQTSFTATVQRPEPQHAELRMETANDASPEEIARTQALLAEVALREDPTSLYQERIASSSTRSRSELGLLRIVAESAMTLKLRVEEDRIYLYVQSGLLKVALNTSSGPRSSAARRKNESIR